MDEITIRNIKKTDNYELAKIIRTTLTEFKANKPGTVFYDNTTDHLFEFFQIKNATYFVALLNDKIAGGAGIYPTDGLPPRTCELVKMYLVPAARGRGIGKMLIQNCIAEASQKKFENMYLETMPELTSAIDMYKKIGFVNLSHPIGNSGHNGCSIWMTKKI